jgi:hypothetical protein
MITEKQQSILEEVRALKEENAAEHDYCLDRIIASARKRQDASGRLVIRLSKGEQHGARQPATRSESKSE